MTWHYRVDCDAPDCERQRAADDDWPCAPDGWTEYVVSIDGRSERLHVCPEHRERLAFVGVYVQGGES